MTGSGGSTGSGGRPEPGTVESLYPFLYSGASDLEAVLADVRRSTVAKTAEITELRRAIAAQDGARLVQCAADAADRFARGGQLLFQGQDVMWDGLTLLGERPEPVK